jgi:PAS domain S-box-containing protein
MTPDEPASDAPLRQAEEFADTLRGEEVDAVVGKEHVLMLRLRETEERLRRSEARYRHIVETQTEMIFRWGADGVVDFANSAYGRFCGQAPETLVGRRPEPSVLAEDRPAMDDALRSLTPDRPLAEIECRMTAADGSVHWVRWEFQGFFDERGEPIETRAIGRDVTDQKNSALELECAQCELAVRNRQLNELYDELHDYSEAVVHDIGAVLRAVANYTGILHEDLSPELTGEPLTCLENLRRVAADGGMLLQQLKRLASLGVQPEETAVIDFSALMDDITAVLGLSPAVKLVRPATWPRLVARPTLLRLLLSNLIDNAVKFNPAPVKRVEVGWLQSTPQSVELFVRDNGIGIDPRYHDRIFKIFKRLHTDRDYFGTGMGLAVVNKAVQHLGGTVRVESEPGRGSTFFVDLPLQGIHL